ncbi:hypothetical protein Pst134EA_031503 [Puccinia striiformis f. sp. tritici]|uniref:uncharacterized protein n=1 Tax=Puccinia striiformis f. sp. tritici TaxID=168172 RepID=UPI002007C029|nr:uncharacterized protein Pst134EA_031503 [Puccinia striiformis f. sp. tritici]KAH9445278.1 hypothetical protein Pst134EA_031503 [Puccinia striiformis f. sp. tritici]
MNGGAQEPHQAITKIIPHRTLSPSANLSSSPLQTSLSTSSTGTCIVPADTAASSPQPGQPTRATTVPSLSDPSSSTIQQFPDGSSWPLTKTELPVSSIPTATPDA